MSEYIKIKYEVFDDLYYAMTSDDCGEWMKIPNNEDAERYLNKIASSGVWELNKEGSASGDVTIWTFTPPNKKKSEPQKNYGLDPNGIGQHELGAKLDKGKPMAGRLLGMFGNALYAVSEVGTFGANKYTEGGWQHVSDGFKRYDDAGMRHILKRGMGEDIDPESGMTHLAHEAWNALAKLELYLREEKKDLNQ